MISHATQTCNFCDFKSIWDGTMSHFQPPPVEVQLANLTPSKHLVEYYRKKILQYDEEDDRIRCKVDEYMKISDQRHKLEEEVLRRAERIKALQNKLNEMQNCLMHEREHVLKIYAENDKLKLRVLEDHERILELLAMTGNTDLRDKIVYIFNEPPVNISIFERMTDPENGKQTKVKQIATGFDKQLPRSKPGIQQERCTSNNLLKSKVDTLELQLEEQKSLYEEQRETMSENYRVHLEEGKTQSLVDKEKIKSLSDRLKKTEELLQLSTLDFLELKKNVRKKEIRWAAEKDALIRNLNHAVNNVAENAEVKALVKEVTDAVKAADDLMKASSRTDILGFIAEKEEFEKSTSQIFNDRFMRLGQEGMTRTQTMGEKHDVIESKLKSYIESKPKSYIESKPKSYIVEAKLLQEELGNIRKLSKSYRSQCLKLEENLNVLKEENDTNLQFLQKRNDLLIQRLLSAKNQQKRLETYRRLEIEGFKTDIKDLKQKIKEMEKQLLKAVLLFEQGEKDMELLKTVHITTVRSKRVTDEIKRLKAKLYELESELRNL